MAKRFQKGFLILVMALIFIIVPTTGLAQTSEAQAGEQITQDALQMLEYLSSGDQEGISSLVTQQVRDGLSADVISKMREYFKGTIQNASISEITTGSLTGQNGEQVEARSAVVTVTTTLDEYHVNVVQVNIDGDWLFYRFNTVNASDYAATLPVKNDQSETMQGIMIALTVVFYAVIAWAIVACVKAKIKLKWLWIILIGLLCICLTVAGNGQAVNAGISFSIYIGTMSNALLYANGGYQLNFLIPVGAVLFLALKKKLEKNYRERQLMEEKMRAMAHRNAQEADENREANEDNPAKD